MTTGSTLPDAYRDEIEKAFGCDIIDSYSCEGTPNTYETTAHDGYNVEYAYGVIEVLDDNNNPITNGIGRVVSTDFWNLAHPFVRYDTQDLVEIKDGRIIRIIGRQCECILSVGGTHITIHNLTKFFANTIPSVSSYRMIRHKNKEVEFIISIENGFQESDKQTIIDYWSNLLQTPITVTIVDHIPLLKNNKHLTIIDEAAN
jgi:phenylacetate-CoA ligase